MDTITSSFATTNGEPAMALSRQFLLVVAPTWDACSAQLQRFERVSLEGDWLPVGAAVKVSLGRAGLAWGRGLHAQVGGLLREKREGDGCAPAGVFALTALFGYATPDNLARAAKLPYMQATADLKAVDDPSSCFYNQIVDQSAVTNPDWQSSEDMLRSDQRYAVGAVVAHNSEPAEPGAGSCIFMHVWEKEGAPTAGCTAMSLDDMTEIAGWLDGAAAPVLVQLPQVEYERLGDSWGLPAFVAQG